MYNITVPVFIRSLNSLLDMLDKAEGFATERKFDAENLLHDRLAPDQYDFTRQVQIACDAAKSTAARLADIESPKMEDVEKTIPELKERIKKTLDFLKSIRPEQIEGSEDKKISIWYMPGKWVTGFEYISEIYLPNFFFHLTTAYSILRHRGVNLGKADYLGELSLKEDEGVKN
jgi:hypothetical protein